MLTGIGSFMASTKAIFQKGFVELADKPFLNVSDMLKVAPDLIKLQSHKSVYNYVSQFIDNEFLRRCFSFHPLLIGGNPFDSSSIYAMIHYLEREWGIHYAMGGTGALVDALVQLIEELNGRIHLNSAVSEIIIKGKRATGIRLADGTVHTADHVISNADVAWTNMNLIPSKARGFRNSDFRWKKLTRYSMSLVVIYFGTKKLYRHEGKLAHHNIILGERYKGFWPTSSKTRFCLKIFRFICICRPLPIPASHLMDMKAFMSWRQCPILGADVDWATGCQAIPRRHYAVPGRQLPAGFARKHCRGAYD